jgi:alkylhydroperoxidase/carboxymuconolactone decarboxylase family protein YurZ
MTTEDYVDEYRARYLAMAGYVYPQFEYIAEKDPEFAEAWFSMMKAWRREGPIPPKYKEMMILLGSCMKHQDMAIRTHMTKAIRLGATPDELLNLMEIVLMSGGGVAFVKGVGILMEVTGAADSMPAGPHWAEPSN